MRILCSAKDSQIFSTKNEKNVKIFCNAKVSHIFLTKNNSVFVILPFEILTNSKLTPSIILNNWSLE